MRSVLSWSECFRRPSGSAQQGGCRDPPAIRCGRRPVPCSPVLLSVPQVAVLLYVCWPTGVGRAGVASPPVNWSGAGYAPCALLCYRSLCLLCIRVQCRSRRGVNRPPYEVWGGVVSPPTSPVLLLLCAAMYRQPGACALCCRCCCRSALPIFPRV